MHKHTMQILHSFTLFVGIQILSFHAFAKEAVMSESTKQGIMIHNPKGAIGDSFKEFGASTAVIIDDKIIKISGQGGWDRDFNFPHKELKDEINQAFENVGFVLESAGSSWSEVYGVTIYLTGKITDEINKLMASQFKKRCQIPPLWTMVQVAGLGLPQMRVEVVVEAYKGARK
ncbi:Rid family hydrolase [Helicobacter pullorum]|nr:Rid family hydrolase [Helicobacter pullorum]